MTETLTDKKKERREKENAYRRTEEYKAKRRTWYELNKEKIKEKRNAYFRTEKGQAERKAQYKKYYEANREKLLARIKSAEVKEKRNASRRTEEGRAKLKAYWEANKEKLKEAVAKRRRRRIKNLNDGYVRRLLVGGTILTSKDIPKELVEVKKLEILIKRDYLDNTTKEERVRQGWRAFKKANRKKINERQREIYAKNKEEIKAKRRNRTPEERAHINALARAAVKRRKLLTKENQNENRN